MPASLGTHALTLLIIGLLGLGGCDTSPQGEAPRKRVAYQPSAKKYKRRQPKTDGRSARPPRQTARPSSKPKPAHQPPTSPHDPRLDAAGGGAADSQKLSGRQAAGIICRQLQVAAAEGPTLVVWLFDVSPSSRELLDRCLPRVKQFYGSLGNGRNRSRAAAVRNLSTAVVTIAEKPQFVLAEPSGDSATVVSAIAQVRSGKSAVENTFTALWAAFEKYKDGARRQSQWLHFIVVSDETGNDAARVDALVEKLVAEQVRVSVIGVPAPLGRVAALSSTFEGGKDEPGRRTILQGPESRELERIHLQFWQDQRSTDILDSGFGPFPLEYLARATGGTFLAVRQSTGGFGRFSDPARHWPEGSPVFDPHVMQRYAPQYVSERRYRQQLDNNAARAALTRAAEMARTETMLYPRTRFPVRNQAQLADDVTAAQRVAAKLELPLQKLYDLLQPGKTAREQEVVPRWQAGYDLALGRVLAARARIEGYNAMLAQLKVGKKFERKTSNTWILKPAASSDAGSQFERMARDARLYLQRVVEQHPGTPWAHLAERELETPMGWQWEEQ